VAKVYRTHLLSPNYVHYHFDNSADFIFWGVLLTQFVLYLRFIKQEMAKQPQKY